MPLDPEQLLAWEFPTTVVSYTEKDTMLYALGVGLGEDPVDERELAFVYERDLVALPTMTAVLGHPGAWYRDPELGIDWVNVVHGEQELVMHGSLAPQGSLTCETRVVDVEDKGASRGGLIRWRRELADTASGQPVATLESTLFCRKDGGFGGTPRPKVRPDPWPGTEPDAVTTRRTSERAGLIYRLSGDLNPVHVDPKVALEAGFDRPILHGLCTFALTTWSVLDALAEGDVSALASVRLRFKSPVLPGQTLRTEMWVQDDRVRFRTTATETGKLVVDAGLMNIHAHGDRSLR
jgi:acyl dehydratase